MLLNGGHEMRGYDFTPYRRSTVGFDRLFDFLESASRAEQDNYPPFDIEKLGDDSYRITLAVAGFKREEIEIVAHQLDPKQAVGELGARHPDEVGELEAALERAGGDADMQEIAVAAAILALSRDHQHVLLRRDVDLVALEPGDGERDPVAVVAQLLDVEGRIIVLFGAVRALQEIEQSVEADGRAAIGGKVETGHVMSSI
jgi:molecular chaperone IbpA